MQGYLDQQGSTVATRTVTVGTSAVSFTKTLASALDIANFKHSHQFACSEDPYTPSNGTGYVCHTMQFSTKAFSFLKTQHKRIQQTCYQLSSAQQINHHTKNHCPSWLISQIVNQLYSKQNMQHGKPNHHQKINCPNWLISLSVIGIGKSITQ